MAALSADTVRELKGALTYSFKIKNATQLYVGSMAAIDSTGYLIPFTGAAGEKLQGRTLATPRADTAGVSNLLGDTAAKPIVEATVCLEGEILAKVAVTGASAITDIGSVVYLSNDNDLTLTRPTRGVVFGTVVRWWSSTTCDVYRFGKAQLDVLSLTGNGKELLYLGSLDCDTITTANQRTSIPLPFRGKFLTFFAMVDVAITGSSGTADLNLEIDGTNVTGGVVTVSTAAGGTKGTKLSGTAITAANTFSEGSLLDIEAVLGTDMTAGRVDLYAEVEHLVGA
jgi:hypothetical protein